jgi:transposase
MDNLLCAGVEVSAEVLLVCTPSASGKPVMREFANDPGGHQALCRYLSRPGATVRVCLESTGLYGLDLALALSQTQGVELMVANPRAVRRFAEACMERNKTDRVDALVLSEFAARMEFQPWQPPSPEALELRSLARRITALTIARTAEKNQQHAAGLSRTTAKQVLRSIEQEIRFLERDIAHLREVALSLIFSNDVLTRHFQLLTSIKGVGNTSAIAILAELAVLPRDLDARQWVSFAGLDPRQHTSGKSVHKRKGISRAGNKYLRSALYFPALVAANREPHVRAFYNHLLNRKKFKLQAIVAIMRKLLHTIWGMLKHDQRFDGAKFFQPKTATTKATLLLAAGLPASEAP